ncbi:Conserved_hypothetical protein [Hexamita inflata]|uniref:Uncharacterized protein n=1 Tax=Hexamita inflata TaxID=28002 RepID=A0AA86TE12_9EUKA|nr:Conserved hypothetical protein [Hexamita inflata]
MKAKTRETTELYSVPETHNLGTDRWQSEYPNLREVNSFSTKNRVEFLDFLSWEYRKFKVKSKIQSASFQGVELRLFGAHPYMPAHPTMQSLKFTNCTFSTDLFLTNCPQLQNITIDDCKGILTLKELNLKKLIFKAEKDQQTVQLTKTRVFGVYLDKKLIGGDCNFKTMDNRPVVKVDYSIKQRKVEMTEEQKKFQKDKMEMSQTNNLGLNCLEESLAVVDSWLHELGK